MEPRHPIQRRLLAEEMTLRRPADAARRYAASQRQGRIDSNPHQVDAVMFALGRLREGGCLLADEVGLGKTIEAGLILAQLQAEGLRRALIVTPAALVGQWQAELADLFGIEACEVKSAPERIGEDGVFVTNREFAGSEKGALLLQGSPPFDLVVIDEAHEMFAGIHRRYDRTHGQYDPDAPHARTAHRVRQVIGEAPVLLLTATPIQNSLAELWGLVQFVERTGTLLGDIVTFKRLFCEGGDERVLAQGQEEELQRRLAVVCQRTLRRQAQEFLEKKFVERQALLLEYRMGPEEKALYDDVTAYLLEPDLCAFRGNQRQLLLIGFHRRMASSLPALAASLRAVTERLELMLEGAPPVEVRQLGLQFALDLEEDPARLTREAGGEAPKRDEPPPPPRARIEAERERVRSLAFRAESLTGLAHDSKARKLVEAVALVLARGRRGEGSGKLVVFTESLATQDYLRDVLLAAKDLGLSEQEITLFRGTNDSPRAAEALARWEEEVGKELPAGSRPSEQVLVRRALVHEFRTRSRVFISTEAGAKGLNLQFCETIVNYDLPWNPQRIEQRIGRCHRYSQTHPVTVINFLAQDNEAQRLTFEILSQKLDLFGRVLDASDHVLHEPRTATPEALATSPVALDLEKRLSRIYERARNREELEADLRRLSADVGPERDAFEQAQARTQSIIQTRLDATVQRAFREIASTLPHELAQFDRDLDRLVAGFLRARAAPFARREEQTATGQRRLRYRIDPCAALPAGYREGLSAVVGPADPTEAAELLHLAHPLVRAALEEAKAACDAAPRAVRYRVGGGEAGPELAGHVGRRGRVAVTRASYEGFEPLDRLVVTAVFEDGEDLAPEAARRLLELPPEELPALAPPLALAPGEFADATEEALFLDQQQIAAAAQQRFERAIAQVERFLEDRLVVLRRRREAAERGVEAARKQREAAPGPEARAAADREVARRQAELEALEEQIERLESRDDEEYERWRRRAHARRYAAPHTTRIVELEFVLA